jgi:hypothetical protein
LIQVDGADAEHDVHDVTFEGVFILGTKITDNSAEVKVGLNTKDIILR